MVPRVRQWVPLYPKVYLFLLLSKALGLCVCACVCVFRGYRWVWICETWPVVKPNPFISQEDMAGHKKWISLFQRKLLPSFSSLLSPPLSLFSFCWRTLVQCKQRLFSAIAQFNVLNYWLDFFKEATHRFVSHGRDRGRERVSWFFMWKWKTHFCPLRLSLCCLWAGDHCAVRLWLSGWLHVFLGWI